LQFEQIPLQQTIATLDDIYHAQRNGTAKTIGSLSQINRYLLQRAIEEWDTLINVFKIECVIAQIHDAHVLYIGQKERRQTSGGDSMSNL
jgi:hypothetical protein